MSRGAVFGFIAAEKTYGVRHPCRVLGVPKIAFYGWVGRGGGPNTGEIEPPGTPGSSTGGSTRPAG